MRRFVVGDIHGAYKALQQCLDRSSFDYERDVLIALGDLCDGWPETRQVVDKLLEVKNLQLILGNHDYWTLEWAITGIADHAWLNVGGDNTIKSYDGERMPSEHVQLFENARVYYVLENKLFVHAGIELGIPIDQQGPDVFMWDRSLFREAMDQYQSGDHHKLTPYDEVYIGHSPIHRLGFTKPLLAADVWLMDTGAGWEGVLSLMDIDTKEVYSSNRVDMLYPPGSGRQRY